MDGRELRQYRQWRDEAQFLRAENQHLRHELNALRPESYRDGIRIGHLEERLAKLSAENQILKHRVAELTAQAKQKPKPAPPSFVKANVPEKKRKKPGRKIGHRRRYGRCQRQIDVHQDVSVPVDGLGQPSCPHCKTQLSDVEHHDRVVEDIIPAKVVTTCYHTTSGWCPSCRKQMESRAEDQPPAHDLPHAQLGINALSTAAVMRVCYRLPLRQITRLFLQLPGLKLSPQGTSKRRQSLRDRFAGWASGWRDNTTA